MIWTMVLSNFIVLSIVAYIGHYTLKKRNLNNGIKFSFFLTWYFLQCLSNIHGPTHLTTLIAFGTFFALTISLYKCTILDALIVSLFSLLFVSSAEFFSMLIMNILFNLNGTTNYSSMLYFFSLVISNLLFFIFSYIFTKIKNIHKHLKLPNHSWFLLIVPFSTLILFMFIPNYFYLVESDKKLVIAFLLISISNIVTLFIFYKLIEKIEVTETLSKEKQNTENEFKIYGQHYYESFNFLHNLLHSYVDIKKLLDEKNYQDLETKLNNLSDKTFAEFNSIYSESFILNVVINNALDLMRKNNVHIRTSLLYSDFSFFDLIDSKTFFTEIIDSCIQSCILESSNIIHINSRKNDHQIIISIYFPSKVDYSANFANNNRLKNLTKKYNINHYYSYDANDNTMCLFYSYTDSK